MTHKPDYNSPFAGMARFAIGAAIISAAIFACVHTAYAQTPSEPARASAVFTQAKALHDGDGVAQDLAAARKLYKRAADLGSNYACINLGFMYFTGEGVPKNYNASRQWYLTAANNGSRDAQRMMSVFYEKGFGVAKNEATAQKWARRAADGWVKPMKVPEKNAPAPAAKPAPAAQKPVIVIKPIMRTAVTPAPEIIVNKPAKPRPAAVKAKPAGNAAQEVRAAQAENIAARKARAREIAAKKSAHKTAAASKASKAVLAQSKTARRGIMLWLGLLTASALALFGAVAIITDKYQTVKAASDNEQFVHAFYKRHRTILRSSYKAASENQGVLINNPDDPWVQSIGVMMIRFAQKQEIVTGTPMRLTTDVIIALQTHMNDAREVLRPLMPRVEDLLIDDLCGSYEPKTDKPKLLILLREMFKRDTAVGHRGSISAAQ